MTSRLKLRCYEKENNIYERLNTYFNPNLLSAQATSGTVSKNENNEELDPSQGNSRNHAKAASRWNGSTLPTQKGQRQVRRGIPTSSEVQQEVVFRARKSCLAKILVRCRKNSKWTIGEISSNVKDFAIVGATYGLKPKAFIFLKV